MKRFRLQCTIRTILLAVTLLATVWLFYRPGSDVAGWLLAAAAAWQVAGLIRYVEKTNEDLTRLLRSIRYSDFSQAFTGDGRGKTFSELSSAFTDVMDDFRAARSEKEENYRYLQTVMQHVGIGLISYKRDGTVGLINTAAKRLLRQTNLKNIRQIAEFSRSLVDLLLEIQSGDKKLVQVADEDEVLQLSIYATEFKLRGELYTLVSIQNIQNELEEKEFEAWQKLTRVLTHEIMNSITPIASLASTVNDLLADFPMPDGGDGSPDMETITDVQSAVQTIEKRSQSLLSFVNAYRSLTRVPKPDIRIFPLPELFGNISRLLEPQMVQRGIRFRSFTEPENLDLTADPELIEQVLINLIKNAMESVSQTPDSEIILSGRIDERGRVIVQVSDNGPGIVEEAIDKVFIPFFTTKKEGSGIGLSLSRQIMRQHGGTLSVISEPDVRTVFTMRF